MSGTLTDNVGAVLGNGGRKYSCPATLINAGHIGNAVSASRIIMGLSWGILPAHLSDYDLGANDGTLNNFAAATLNGGAVV